jgi:hypothetical protein
MASVSKIGKDEKMITWIIGGVTILLLVAVGVGSYHKTGEPDGKMEELAESGIERVIEEKLNLEKGTMQGKIDLTPGSPEGRSS